MVEEVVVLEKRKELLATRVPDPPKKFRRAARHSVAELPAGG